MKRKHTIIAASVVVVLLVWFLRVDRSWFVEDCPSCGFGRDILQYRVFSFPIHERVQEHSTLIQHVANDLGVACTHPALERWHKYRWWGLCICAYPKISGIHRIGVDTSWYDDTVVADVKTLAQSNPSLRDEFVERVLVKRDMDYWKTFVQQIKVGSSQQPPADSNPHPGTNSNQIGSALPTNIENAWVMSADWAGFMGAALAVKSNTYYYWFYSDVIIDGGPTYPIRGQFILDGTGLHLDATERVYSAHWLLVTNAGRICLSAPSDVGDNSRWLIPDPHFDPSEPFRNQMILVVESAVQMYVLPEAGSPSGQP